ncbi:MAG TPA: TIGR04086 family membrane protein [Rubrobacter sp.]|nr:TIGR04086 family membrane protein [Rubrobacter sp.]
MDDRPQDKAEDRRRRGPLGDEGGTEETRRVPQGGEDPETRQVPSEDAEREAATRENAMRSTSSEGTASRRAAGEEDPETRVIRTPGSEDTREDIREDIREEDEIPYTREERLRDVYGGVDWLASFVGCVFALVCGSVLLLLLSGLVLAPLGFTLDLEGRELDAAIITGLVIVGFILFLAFFFGGYVTGRLVRFDGGRNGAATVGWGILLGVIFAVFGFLLAGLLPGPVFELVRAFQNGVLSTAGNLTTLGIVGAGIVVGTLLLVLLGGFIGGRLGNRYHTRIDQAN